MGKQKVWTASERRLVELVGFALEQLQDDEVVIKELLALQDHPSDRDQTTLTNIGLAMSHIHDGLRKLGTGVRKREPFEDLTPIWELQQTIDKKQNG